VLQSDDAQNIIISSSQKSNFEIMEQIVSTGGLRGSASTGTPKRSRKHKRKGKRGGRAPSPLCSREEPLAQGESESLEGVQDTPRTKAVTRNQEDKDVRVDQSVNDPTRKEENPHELKEQKGKSSQDAPPQMQQVNLRLGCLLFL
jgi:hypothetical protein